MLFHYHFSDASLWLSTPCEADEVADCIIMVYTCLPPSTACLIYGASENFG